MLLRGRDAHGAAEGEIRRRESRCVWDSGEDASRGDEDVEGWGAVGGCACAGARGCGGGVGGLGYFEGGEYGGVDAGEDQCCVFPAWAGALFGA